VAQRQLPHFLHHCEEQVVKTIADFEMITPNDRVLVAGKDSLGPVITLGYR
jgi:tRNA(Ile)-lysidine synthase TilS/MesJ